MRRMLIVLMLSVLSGCATSPSGAGREVSPPGLAGAWSGVITGLDMASAADVVATPARLEIGWDGRWKLSGGGGVVASGTTRPGTQGLVLDGTMLGGDHMTVGRYVTLRLRPGPRSGMYGGADTFFLGHRVNTEIRLGRAAG